VKVPADQPSIQAAVQAAIGRSPDDTCCVVEITDDGRYEETLTIDLRAALVLEIRAADGVRPHVVLGADMPVTGDHGAKLILNGLLVSGHAVAVPATRPDGSPNRLETLAVRHATLVPGLTLQRTGDPADPFHSASPGAPSVVVQTVATRLEVERSITGAIELVPEASGTLRDSIVDAGNAVNVAWRSPGGAERGGNASFDGSTVIGVVRTSVLEASNSIFASPTDVARLQQGCVRYSALPETSVAPRRYACVPSSAVPHASPGFTTLQYGVAGYARLTASTSPAIRTGADDESEMGAFHYLYEPQRESDLRIRLEEYLRVGLEAGIFHES
jgi:hypothetical protein